jgi:hypothetical protein
MSQKMELWLFEQKFSLLEHHYMRFCGAFKKARAISAQSKLDYFE